MSGPGHGRRERHGVHVRHQNGTGVLESQTAYPNWPSTTGARTTDLVWAFGAGKHHSAGTGASRRTSWPTSTGSRTRSRAPGWDFTSIEQPERAT